MKKVYLLLYAYVWLCSLLNAQNSKWIVYDTTNSGLPANVISYMSIEGRGTIWIGLDFGLINFDGTNWIDYSQALTYGNVSDIGVEENGIPFSIEEHKNNCKELIIIPNPVSNKMTIEIPSKGTFSILNINSQPLLQKEVTDPSIKVDVNGWQSGVYFVRLTGERTIQVGKFVKK